ncbi:MAG: CHASE2 domain-containing protein, partial [Verrucomicrobiota bacterium]|nr:CHASE2 domain-containing protein [Verrucomicrobiota bacterium]
LDDHVFRYTAPPRIGFGPHSLFEIFVPDYWQHNYQNGEFFRGKIVLIGAEGNWQHDEHPTPFGSMPGPEVHLNAINAALHHEFISELPASGKIFVAVIAVAIAVTMSLRIRSPWWRLLLVVAVNVAVIFVALAAFNRFSVYLPFVGPVGALDLTVVLSLVSDFAGERMERKRVRRTLERYVSRDVVSELLDKPKLYAEALGGVVKPVSILFSDIRGYSTVSARTDPQALVAQLNEYLTSMVDCVFEHGGTLDKFIGDAVMAVWGNTRTAGVREDAANAVRAAIAMRAALVRLNEGWRQRGLPELRAGIAINHGRVVVGNIGSPQRMEFTVVGDAVNTSWRLQELTKTFGFDLLVGENVAKLVIEDFELRPLGPTKIRDNEPMEVFAVTGEIEVASASKATAGTSRVTR